MGLEQKKDVRRQEIINAAEFLIRETGSTDFSMNALAAQAGFSPPTTYNLIGSKAKVLYILLNQYQDRADLDLEFVVAASDPFQQVLHAADLVIGLYTADSQFIRALMRFLLGIPDPIHRPAFMVRGYKYWARASRGLAKEGYLNGAAALDALARDFLVYFTGVIDMWVHEELDDEQFHIQSRCGVLMRLIGLAHDENREWLQAEFDQCHCRLAPLYANIEPKAED